MRVISVIVGLVLSVPALVFFGIGAQTFTRTHERLLAQSLALATGSLLVLSLVLIFTAAVQRVQLAVLLVTIALLAVAVVLARK